MSITSPAWIVSPPPTPRSKPKATNTYATNVYYTHYYSQQIPGLKAILTNHATLMVAGPASVAVTGVNGASRSRCARAHRPGKRASRPKHFALATYSNPELIQPVMQGSQPI